MSTNDSKASTRVKVPLILTFAILSIYLLQSTGYIVTPALADLGAYYNDPANAVYISTLLGLGGIVASLIAGATAGKVIGYKTMAIIAASIMTVTGILPYFLGKNLILVLICRFFFGLGMGLSLPISNVFVISFFEGEARDRMLGISTLLANLSGVAYQLIGGAVCAIDVRYTWFVHLIAVVPLVLAFALREPQMSAVVAEQKSAEAAEAPVEQDNRPTLPLAYIVIALGYGLVFMFHYPALLTMSTIITGEGIGTAATAGIITALYSVGGMIGGALFAPANKALGRMIVPLAWVVLVLAMACGAFGNSLFFLGACTLLCGVAIYIAMPAVLGMVAVIVPPKGQALASSIFWAALNALGFLAAVWMNFLIGLNGDVRFPIYVGMIAIAVVAVVWFLVSLRKPKAER